MSIPIVVSMSKYYWQRKQLSRVKIDWLPDGRLQIEIIRPPGALGVKMWELDEVLFIGNSIAVYMFLSVRARNLYERVIGFLMEWGVNTVYYEGLEQSLQVRWNGAADERKRFLETFKKDFETIQSGEGV